MNINHHQTGNHPRIECKVVETNGDAPEWIKIEDDQVQVVLGVMADPEGHKVDQDLMMGSVIEADSTDHTMGEIKTVDSMVSTVDIIMTAVSIM